MISLAKRLICFWVYGGALASIVLFALTPVLGIGWPQWKVAVWLTLPVYMLHQLEEHGNDRFRRFVNTRLAGGRPALSTFAVFLINVPGVWGVIALSFALASLRRPGFGLIAVYLLLVNALAHVGCFIALRVYNPGLWTALGGFFVLGVWALLTLQKTHPEVRDHALGLFISVAIHAAIVAQVLRNNTRSSDSKRSTVAGSD